jgi:hypothetical protein
MNKKYEVIWISKTGKQHHTFMNGYSENDAVFKVQSNRKTFKELFCVGTTKLN